MVKICLGLFGVCLTCKTPAKEPHGSSNDSQFTMNFLFYIQMTIVSTEDPTGTSSEHCQ